MNKLQFSIELSKGSNENIRNKSLDKQPTKEIDDEKKSKARQNSTNTITL